MKNKSIAIIQPNYIPWKGYFDIINSVDEFFILDVVQYTRRDWRNRNRIKTQHGVKWLTIPVDVKGRFHEKIKDVKISDKDWGIRHWATISANYAKTPYFRMIGPRLKDLYLKNSETYLSRINYSFIKCINSILGITTRISWCDYYDENREATLNLMDICKQAKATIYVSGPTAKNYFDENRLLKENIRVEWFDYSGYQPYDQPYPPFDHHVSILDLIFCMGPDAFKYMKSFPKIQ